MALQRSISSLALLFTSLACMIGSGWLFGAFYAAKIAGPAAVVSWLIGGFMVSFIAMAFSELSAMLPLTGGIVRYTHFSHGTLVSFCMSWLAWLSCVAVAPTEVQSLLQYSASYFPWLVIKKQNMHVLTLPGLTVATVLMLLVTYLNILAVRLLMRFNVLITWCKLLIPILVVICIVASSFHVQNFTGQTFAPEGWHGVLWALPTAGVIFSFLGFREATSLAGEARRPGIGLPVAVLGSVLLCTVLYVLLQIAFIGSLSEDALSHGWAELSYAGDSGPFAGVAASLGLGFLVLIIYADAIVSPFGTAMIYTATTSRLNYAMSLNRYTPMFMLKLNKQGVPARAVWVNFVIGMFLFLPLPTWQALVGFQSVAIVLAYAVGPISLLCLRQQVPHIPRPFAVPAKYIVCLVTFYFCNLMVYWAGWETIWRLMIAVVGGFLLLLVYRHYSQPQDKLNWRSAWWLVPYFATVALLSYIGNFGGGLGILTFGWDFAAIFAMSMVFLAVAYASRLSAEEAQARLKQDPEFKLYLDTHVDQH